MVIKREVCFLCLTYLNILHQTCIMCFKNFGAIVTFVANVMLHCFKHGLWFVTKISCSCTDTDILTHTHRRNRFTALFPGLPGWAGARRNLLLDFMVQGKITEADTPTIRLGTTSSGLISSISPAPFLRGMPFLPQPSQFILAWDRRQICGLAYLFGWLISCS